MATRYDFPPDWPEETRRRMDEARELMRLRSLRDAEYLADKWRTADGSSCLRTEQ